MNKPLSRDELIILVRKIMNCEGSEHEIDEMINLLERNVPDPHVSDLIFWSDIEYSPEEIVDKAMSYKPIII
ncbi:bacteriocin immunity protein [Paenibacillus sp. 1001270B_150601_E10]|uniref:bacteriocin immunity protein n=1 Tax=Paenibacillus sp. 1001270B_150601_E10 TaxID=2787079 RepID=UPI00189ECCFB|nr:bacteriocin immunity protein [Paenibacillus sp. 1001270B_150601_E10]